MYLGNVMVIIFVVLIGFVYASGEKSKSGGRRSRILTFDTSDGDVSISLEFSIPFVRIPIKKTMETFGTSGLGLPSVNVNIAGIAIGGAIVVFISVMLPLLVRSYTDLYPNNKYARLLDNAHFGADTVLDFTNNLMLDSRTMQGCALRVTCWAAQKSSAKGGPDTLLSIISSNNILSSIMNATAITEAISSGKNGRECTYYGPCSLREEQIPILMNSITSFGRSKMKN